MIIHREYGLLLRNAGEVGASDKAIQSFKEALKESPYDSITLHALCKIYESRGYYKLIIELIEPIIDKIHTKNSEYIFPTLAAAYVKQGDMLKANTLKSRFKPISNNT